MAQEGKNKPSGSQTHYNNGVRMGFSSFLSNTWHNIVWERRESTATTTVSIEKKKKDSSRQQNGGVEELLNARARRPENVLAIGDQREAPAPLTSDWILTSSTTQPERKTREGERFPKWPPPSPLQSADRRTAQSQRLSPLGISLPLPWKKKINKYARTNVIV